MAKPREYLYAEIKDLTCSSKKFEDHFGAEKKFWILDQVLESNHQYPSRKKKEPALDLYQLQLFCNSTRKLLGLSKEEDSRFYDFWYQSSSPGKFVLNPKKLPLVIELIKKNEKFGLPFGKTLLVDLLREQYPVQTSGRTFTEIKVAYENGALKLQNGSRIDATTFRAIIEHSFFQWHTDAFEDYYVSSGLSATPLGVSWITLANSETPKVWADISGDPISRCSFPVINIAWEDNKNLSDNDAEIVAKNHLSNFLQRKISASSFGNENIRIVTHEHRVGLTKYCVSFSYFHAFNSTEPILLKKENYDLVRIAINKFQEKLLHVEGGDSLEPGESTIDRCSERFQRIAEFVEKASEPADSEHFYQEPLKWKKELEYYDQKDFIDDDELIKEYQVRLSLAKISLQDFDSVIDSKYNIARTNSFFAKGFPREISETLSFYFDETFNFISCGSVNPTKVSPDSAFSFKKKTFVNIPFGYENEVWHPKSNLRVDSSQDLDAHAALLKSADLLPIDEHPFVVSDNFIVRFFKEFDSIANAVSAAVPVINSAFLKDKSKYFSKDSTGKISFLLPGIEIISFEDMQRICPSSAHPFLRFKTACHFFWRSDADKLTSSPINWNDFLGKFHYPLLVIKKKQSASPSLDIPKEEKKKEAIPPSQEEPLKPPTSKETELGNRIGPPLVSLIKDPTTQRDCIEELKKIKSVDDAFEFFFHKFPWHQLLTRMMLSMKEKVIAEKKLKELGQESDPIFDVPYLEETVTCISDANITRLYCTYLDIKNLVLHYEEYLKVGLLSIPTVPDFQYFSIVDIAEALKIQFRQLILDLLFKWIEGILGFAIRDLFMSCGIEDAFCRDIPRNDQLAVETVVSKKKVLSSYNDDPSFIGYPKYLANATNPIELFSKNKSYVYLVINSKFGLGDQDGKKLDKFFQVLSLTIDDLELYSLLYGGNPPDELLKIIATIAESISPEFGEFFSIPRRIILFFDELAKYISKDKIIKSINLNQFFFTIDPCAPPNSAYDQEHFDAVVNALKKSGWSDAKIKQAATETTEEHTTKIASLCGFISTKAFDLTHNLPLLISQPSLSMIKGYWELIRDIKIKIDAHNHKLIVKSFEKDPQEVISPKKKLDAVFNIDSSVDLEKEKKVKEIVKPFVFGNVITALFIGTLDNKDNPYFYIDFEGNAYLKTQFSAELVKSNEGVDFAIKDLNIFFQNIASKSGIKIAMPDPFMKEAIFSDLKTNIIQSSMFPIKPVSTKIKKLLLDAEPEDVLNPKWLDWQDELDKSILSAKNTEPKISNADVLIAQIKEVIQKS